MVIYFIMHLSKFTSLATILSAFPLAFCYINDERLPPLRFLGGKTAVKELRAARQNAELLNEKRWFSDPDVNKHKKCGPGIGSCDAGDW